MHTRKREKNASPIIRFRFVLVVVGAIALLIAGPLMMVWKQVYINTSSLKLDHAGDTLAILSRETAALKLTCEKLSSTGRIEQIAKSSLNLDYPSSSQIEIIEMTTKQERFFDPARRFLASLKKTILRDRG
jgi:cell division protein FtsL